MSDEHSEGHANPAEGGATAGGETPRTVRSASSGMPAVHRSSAMPLFPTDPASGTSPSVGADAAPRPAPTPTAADGDDDPDTTADSRPSVSPPAPSDGDGRGRAPFPLPDLREGADGEEETSHAEFTNVFDIIDGLQNQLVEAKGSLFAPGQVRIDRDRFGDDLDELKRLLPVQLERASALMREAERRLQGAQTQATAIVAEAQSRAAQMVQEANEQAHFLAGQENVTDLARQKARDILDQAQAKSDHLTQGADDYAAEVMEALRRQLTKMGNDVDAGLAVLHERQKAAAALIPHLDSHDYPEAN